MRASADMLSGDECGEPRARSCACRCGHALVTEKVTADTIESAPVFGGSRARSHHFPQRFFRESNQKKLADWSPYKRITHFVSFRKGAFSHLASGKRHASEKDARASNAARALLALLR